MKALFVILMLVLLVTAGCVSPSSTGEADGAGAGLAAEIADVNAWRPCEHPWPCGDGSEWPVDLAGPFGVLNGEAMRVDVAADDGTLIGGWILRPDVPADVRVPVVLLQSIYIGPAIYHPETWPPAFETELDDFLAERLVKEGFAVAVFNVRGTGVSEGCFSMQYPTEGADAVAVIEYLTEQPWSNGRIGMIGVSYDGLQQLAAATFNPPGLKALIPIDPVTPSMYTLFHSPQGAKDRLVMPVWFSDIAATGPSEAETPGLSRLPQHLCEDAIVWRQTHLASFTSDQRDGAFYEARNMNNQLAAITAAMFLPMGHYDSGPYGGAQGLAVESGRMWHAFDSAPKRMLLGPWGHVDPAGGTVPHIWIRPDQDRAAVEAWHDEVVGWYDFWLKGLGDPPKVGVVEYRAEGDNLRTTSAWPPVDVRKEVLYMDGTSLAPNPGSTAVSYTSVAAPGVPALGYGNDITQASPNQARAPATHACAPEGSDDAAVVFRTPVTADAVFLAGNPLAYLNMASDSPGGTVSVYLFDVAPGPACDPVFLSNGAANLRLHASGYDPIDFPTNQAVPVRIDMDAVVHEMAAGHQLVLVVSAGDLADWATHPDSGRITVGGDGTAQASHVVIPIVEGTLGGAAPEIQYPLRPFTPEWYATQEADA